MRKLLLLFLMVLWVNADVSELDLSFSNTLTRSRLNSSSVSQASLKIGDSILNSSSMSSENSIGSSDISNGSLVGESNIELLDSSRMEECDITLSSTIENANISKSIVSQSEVSVSDSTLSSVDIISHSNNDCVNR
jgi:hypothetical protein